MVVETFVTSYHRLVRTITHHTMKAVMLRLLWVVMVMKDGGERTQMLVTLRYWVLLSVSSRTTLTFRVVSVCVCVHVCRCLACDPEGGLLYSRADGGGSRRRAGKAFFDFLIFLDGFLTRL